MLDVGIMGGGITGLFTARFLGAGSEVLEADDRPGGLARCFRTNGVRSDIGGHILFSKDKEALSHEILALEGN
ncbi:NAD(P)-binding protein, partial [Salmonella sp. SAL4355]|uniref:NAD(P)-binding protein n=1 Tax=Salmonella sp. SAL4355 TaxID=3159876 RepID=UPI00397AB2FE